MPMAAGPASPAMAPTKIQNLSPAKDTAAPVLAAADAVAKDAILTWFRGEFAAANAIIDALCGHLKQVGLGSEYDSVLAAVHRRRLNWIPVLQMQNYHSIADVAVELRRVAEKKSPSSSEEEKCMVTDEGNANANANANGTVVAEKAKEGVENGVVEEKQVEVVGVEEEDSPNSEITDSGSQEVQHIGEQINICSNHEDCNARPAQIKLTKGFSAKEQVKGHMVNVVKGLKLYEDVFTEPELSTVTDFVNDLRAAGLNGELSGDTFILFNKQMKGIKRELIQFGIPIFGHIKDEAAGNNETSNMEPIPSLLQGLVDHLIQWQLIPEYKRPNGCIIHYFDEDDYSQPFLKPPHLEQPIATLLLSKSTMAFGRTLASDSDGNFRGPLMLSLKQGSLLVMRGNSADMARHVMCPSPNQRVSITFFRVRPDINQIQSPPTSPMASAMTLWQPGVPSPYPVPNGGLNGYETPDSMSEWGVLHAPVVMLAPLQPVVLSPKSMPRGGTGVFLPWTVKSRKPAKHLPPRAQRGRYLALAPPVEAHVPNSVSDTGISIAGKSA